MKVSFTILFFIFMTSFQNISYSQNDDKIKTAIDSIANKYISNPKNAGLAIGIISGSSNDNSKHRPEYFYYGEIKKGSEIKPNENTIFKMGSVGKTFTTMLLAHFISNKEYDVNLNDPISKFFPFGMKLPVFKDESGKEYEISLLDLATHFSSLPRTPKNAVGPPNYTFKKLEQFLETYELKKMPGETFLYSNLGFGLLGYIMTLIEKKTYQQLENEIFCDELSMNETRIELNKDQLSRLATSYSKGKEMKFNVISSPGFFGAGGNSSTMNNMMKYLSYNLGLENVEINSLLDSLHIIRKGTGGRYLKWMGLGWQISELKSKPGTKFIWKDGATNGFTTYIAFEEESKTGVVVLSNSGGAPTIGTKIINLINEN